MRVHTLRTWPLHVRLTLVFLVILLALGAFVSMVAQRGATVRALELTQRLNEPVARYMVENGDFAGPEGLRGEALAELAPHVMTINPSVEVYLLDAAGAVVAQASTLNFIDARRVDLAPVTRFLEGDVDYPLLGEDPLHDAEPRPFSAWPVERAGTRFGYVYAVLAGEQHATLLEALRQSGAARDLAVVLAGALLLAGLAGALVFFTLTRRLRELTARVEGVPDAVSDRGRDEIDHLTHAYDSLTARLQAQYAKLQASDANRRQLVAAVSHDLRTPLTTLRGYIETLQLGESKIDAGTRARYLAIAHRHAEKLRARVDELFELSRLSAEGVTLQLERFSLRELAHDCLQDFAPVAAERGVGLDVLSDPDAPADAYALEADIALVQRTFENLVDNALRHTDPGDRISIGLSRSDADRVLVDVRDDGHGMSPEAVARVFDSCWTGDGDDRARGGLGLAIVARAVELHGGRISVASRAGIGTRFRVELPALGSAASRP